MTTDLYLQHHGIKGQKHGERRFQNEDGSYTELGKERRRVGFSEERKSKVRSFFDPTIKAGKDKSPQSPAEKIVKSTGSIVGDATSLTNAISSISQRNKTNDFSEMTDAELRSTINRLQMERQLSELTKQESRGMQTVKDILSIAGPVVSIVGGSVAIASTVRSWKKNNN